MPPDAHEASPAHTADTALTRPDTAPDKTQTALQAHAQAIAAALVQAREAPRHEAVVVAAEGWQVCVLAFPMPAEHVPGLNKTDLAVLQVLAEFQDDNLPARRICEELRRDRKKARSEITVKRTLAKLTGMGLVRNQKMKNRGYHLAGLVPPLFRRLQNDTQTATVQPSTREEE